MNIDTGAFKALRDEVTELAARLEHYRHQAAAIRMIEEAALEEAGIRPCAADAVFSHIFAAGRDYERELNGRPTPGRRSRHLRAVRDDAS